MNAATAGGILGGEVKTTVSPAKTDISNTHTANAKSSAGPTSANASGTNYLKAGMDDSDCSFVLPPSPAAAELHIEVRTMNDPKKEFAMFAARCGTKATALKAVGNEASVCVLDSTVGQTIHQVVGRVRDRAFIIRLTTNQNSIPSVLDDKVRRAADIVAGNLF